MSKAFLGKLTCSLNIAHMVFYERHELNVDTEAEAKEHFKKMLSGPQNRWRRVCPVCKYVVGNALTNLKVYSDD